MIEYENLFKANEPLMEEFRSEFDKFLHSGWFILGESTKSFESEFAKYHDLNHFVGSASGLDSLIFSLILSELPKGSEVIVPSNTYFATILAILRAGYVPILVEPDIHSYNIDPTKIEEVITDKTKALMIVHLYGNPCEMDSIMKIVEKRNLTLIEDCAQAHGASYKDKKVGTFGNYSAFSFYPTKNLGALGDGGGVGVRSKEEADTLRMIRNYGSAKKYEFDVIGYNSRLDEIQSCFLRVKLKYLDKINEIKRDHAERYFSGLKKTFICPQKQEGVSPVYHIFNIRHPERDRLREFLLNKGIKTEVHYPISPHRQKVFAGVLKGEYPICDEIHKTTLSLPISWYHSKEDIEFVIQTLNNF